MSARDAPTGGARLGGPSLLDDREARRRRHVLRRDGHICQRCGARGGPGRDATVSVRRVAPADGDGATGFTTHETVCTDCLGDRRDDRARGGTNLFAGVGYFALGGALFSIGVLANPGLGLAGLALWLLVGVLVATA